MVLSLNLVSCQILKYFHNEGGLAKKCMCVTEKGRLWDR